MNWQQTVTNLLKKAEDPATTREERESLSEKAAYLMAKYGITTLLDQPADTPLNVVNVELGLGAPYAKLRATLIHRTALAFGCKAVRSGSKIRVFGLQADIDNFTQMYVSLWIQALFALAISEKPEWVHGKTHNHSYLLGFIDEVTTRVAASTRKAAQDADSPTVSTALVFAKRATSIDAAVSLIYPSLRKGTASRATSSESYASGAREGRRADINQPRMGGSHISRPSLT